MNPSTANGVPYTIPPEPNRVPSMLIALLVHAGLLGFLWVGIRWQNVEPVSVEAEVWDMKTESAAPPPAPRPTPVPQPQPEPVQKVAPPPPPKVAEPVAPKAPDIALEREKEKKKLLEKKLADEKVAKEKARQLAAVEAKEKELADKKEKELAEKKAALDKAKADKLAKAAKDLAEEKAVQRLRELEMKRITSGVGTNGGAERSTAPRIDKSYQAAISSKIKGATNYGGDKDGPGNPQVDFRIQQLPTGEIISVKKLKSSGIAAFDDAVERGINNSSPLPKKKDGTVERSLDISFKLKEFSDAQ
jgi:colicin import membrane protein